MTYVCLYRGKTLSDVATFSCLFWHDMCKYDVAYCHLIQNIFFDVWSQWAWELGMEWLWGIQLVLMLVLKLRVKRECLKTKSKYLVGHTYRIWKCGKTCCSSLKSRVEAGAVFHVWKAIDHWIILALSYFWYIFLLLTGEYLPHTVLDCKVTDPQVTTSSNRLL